MEMFEVTYDRKKQDGVYAISLVNSPAIKRNFIKLSTEERKIVLKTIDEEKRELIGIVLEPNLPIYRNDEGHEYNIVFSEQVIKDLLIGFAENGNQNNSNLEHKEELALSGVVFFENWIVEDEAKDKSVNYDLKAKKGSWVTKLKIENDEVWDKYVKTGEVQGFSIEAVIDLKEIKMSDKVEETKKVELNDESKSWFETLLKTVFTNKPKEVAMSEDDLKDKNSKLEGDGEEEEEEIKAELIPEEMKVEIKKLIEEVLEGMMNKVDEEMKTELNKVKESVDTEMKELKKSNVEMKSQLEEIEKQPITQKLRSSATQKDFKDMTVLEKRRYNRETNS